MFNRHGAANSMLGTPHVMTGRNRSNARQFISQTSTKSTPPTYVVVSWSGVSVEKRRPLLTLCLVSAPVYVALLGT